MGRRRRSPRPAARDVPVLLSVGYSACHWCHVMAHECFEDAEVAAEMNARFVNVKVDREERPDVDAIYMDAVQAMTGRGGWPMTVFLTPDGEPFYGGTYFPKPQLPAADGGDRRRLAQPARRAATRTPTPCARRISRTARLRPADDAAGRRAPRRAPCRRWPPASTREWGGFGAAPKFPSTMSLDLVLAAYLRSGDDAAREIVTTSLDAMASGGMYDHIGGGFARYSVDREWLVPHFEKMLYDQALLVRVYAHAAVALDEPRWRQVVAETVDYVLRDLRQPAGGFSSAEDADSPGPDGHGHEGLFHTWTVDEVRAVLGADADAALELLRHHRRRATSRAARSPTASTPAARSRGRRPIEEARQRLFEAREQRPRPGLDDKVLTEWNALMSRALAEAGALLDRPDWIDAAVAGRRLPAPRAAPARRALVPLVARRRRPAGPPRRARRRPRRLVDAFTRLGRGHRRGALDRRGAGRRRHAARPLLGRRPRRPVHDARRRRGARRPPEGPVRQRHAVGQLDRRRRPVPPRRAHRRGPLRQPRRPHPAARRRRRRPGAVGVLPRPRRGRPARAAASPRSPSSATGPTSSPSSRERWRPDVVLAWGEPLRLAAVGRPRRRPGLRLPRLRLPGAAGHAGGPRAPNWPSASALRSTGRHPPARRGG